MEHATQSLSLSSVLIALAQSTVRSNSVPIVQALQNPVMIVAIGMNEGSPQFLEIVESAEPRDLFFEGAKIALDTSVSF